MMRLWGRLYLRVACMFLFPCINVISETKSPKSMVDFAFDSNIFDKVLDGEISSEDLKANEHSYSATHVQLDELSRTPNEELRNQLLTIFNEIGTINLPTESFIVGVSKVGQAKLGDGRFFEDIKKGNPRHTNDALIGEVALKNKLTLVAEDKQLRNKVNKLGGRAITYEEYEELIGK